MPKPRKDWREELAIIDRTMKAISGITDPEELVDVYWDGVSAFLPSYNFVSVSRRGETPPSYLITRSSRFEVHHNPWTQRDRLPRLSGGLLGEIIYGNQPVIIDDLPARLSPDDPAWFHLQGFHALLAMPQYDGGEGLNVSAMLLGEGEEIDYSLIPILHWQSGLFGRGTQNLVLRNQLAAAHAAIDRELQIIGEIQRSLLPAKLPDIPGLQLAADYQTSARAGGDYYDFFPIGDNAWGIFIADVAGHGAPAAVLMAITHAIAHTRPGSPTPPGALLADLNRHLTRSYTASGTFVTAFYAVYNPATHELRYTTAGHNTPRLLRNGAILPLDARGGLPLGIIDQQNYEEASLTLHPGDLLLLYTDGITESMAPTRPDGTRELFGEARLDQVLQMHSSATADQLIAAVNDAVRAHTSAAPPADDQTLVALRCTA